jgi:hypothetical protein
VFLACQWIKELSTHAHNYDRSAAAAIFANGTYFLDTLLTLVYSAPINDLEVLQQRVGNACQEIQVKPGIFDRVRTSVRSKS